MATGSQKRTRSERVAALDLPPTRWERLWLNLRRRDVLVRLLLALVAAIAMTAVLHAWNPPFAYRIGYVPPRVIVSRVDFRKANPEATRAAQRQARGQVPYIYLQDPQPLVALRSDLQHAVVKLIAAKDYQEVAGLWEQFMPTGAAQPAARESQQFNEFRAELKTPEDLERFEKTVAAAMAPFEERGLLDKPSEAVGKGNPNELRVCLKTAPDKFKSCTYPDVLIGDKSAIQQSLREKLPHVDMADRVFAWLAPKIQPTLTADGPRTRTAMDKAADAVAEVADPFAAGQPLTEAGKPLTADQLSVLRLEYDKAMSQRPVEKKFVRAAAVAGLVFVLFLLSGMYIRTRQRVAAPSMIRATLLLLLILATVSLARVASADPWRAALAPLMLFGMTTAIVYRQDVSLLLTSIAALMIVLATGHGLGEFLFLIGTTTVANVNMRQIRSRRKLIYVGLLAGGVACVLRVGLAMLDDQPLTQYLLVDAAAQGLWALAAGFVMFGLLPFIEQVFGVLTDLSLLELGDASHPLLQELVRRAPSTYNHSLTVGSIGEAAAEAIGGRGLLVRVGAYFHDIGKMLKPGYFVENQGVELSRHDGLVPAMSTLVIIAHIKDGADLARQYRIPQPIIDLIAQHHGTTLVEYFYDRAQEQSQTDPNGNEPDETTFRYPGPKPQTKEAAVLMLADAVESASRTLVDPAPSRIEGLVRSIAERKLHDGQFDESGLTLRELRTIERSLAMSLTSIYHGRIKYPEQRSASASA